VFGSGGGVFGVVVEVSVGGGTKINPWWGFLFTMTAKGWAL